MTATSTRLITAEELFDMGDIGRCELIRGEIAHMVPPGFDHGDVTYDLAVEVLSPSDRMSEVNAKVNEWLAAGAQSVWVVDPPNRTIAVHRPGGQIIQYVATVTIADEPALPGFTLKLDELFGQE